MPTVLVEKDQRRKWYKIVNPFRVGVAEYLVFIAFTMLVAQCLDWFGLHTRFIRVLLYCTLTMPVWNSYIKITRFKGVAPQSRDFNFKNLPNGNDPSSDAFKSK